MQLTRRTLLGAGAATVFLAACGSSDDDPSTAASSTTATSGTAVATELTAAHFASLGTCILLPETTAGPYPLDEQFDRRDITEGYAGHPMRLGLRVVDDACMPVPDATVEVWHTDATGDYSAYTDNGSGKDEGEGTTFFRGTQTANDEGIVEFQTIYPGWYRGRTPHIHLRVHLEDSTALTSQMFFDDDYTASVYATGEYTSNGLPDTSNDEDSIARGWATNGTLLHLTRQGDGTLALLNLGVAT
jgi:protocatechuate 3,4-dioxygenase beta subunit